MTPDQIAKDLLQSFTAVMAPNPVTWAVGLGWLTAAFDAQQRLIGNIGAIWKLPTP